MSWCNKGTAFPSQTLVASTTVNTNLRSFLECFVEYCYSCSVTKSVPLLKAEYIAADHCLRVCKLEFEAILLERLKDGAGTFSNN